MLHNLEKRAMKKRNVLVAIWVFVLSQFSFAQDTLQVSKEAIVSGVLSENLQIKIADKAYLSARADHRQSNALFLPQVSLSHTAISTTNPLMAFGSKLNQEVLTQADFNPMFLNDPARIENYMTQIEVVQPLINLDGALERRAAQKKTDAYQLQSERTKEYLELEASKAYMQLQLAYKGVTVLQAAEQTIAAHHKLIQDYYAQGLVQKTAVLMVEVKQREIANQLQYALSGVQNASAYIGVLLNDKESKVYLPTDPLVFELDEVDYAFSDNRKDLQAMQKSTEAYHKMYQSTKMKFLPRLNAFGNYQMHDDELFQTGAKGYLVGAQLSWDVFSGFKNVGKSQKAKVEYHKSQLESQVYKNKSQMEFDQAQRALLDALNKVQLTELSWQQAQEVHRITQNRFEQGLEKSADLLQAETQMMQKEMEHVQALFEYNFTKHYLEFLTK